MMLSSFMNHDESIWIFFSGYMTDKGCAINDAPLISTGMISPDCTLIDPITSPEISYNVSQLKISNTHEKNASSPDMKSLHVSTSQVIPSHGVVSQVAISQVSISQVSISHVSISQVAISQVSVCSCWISGTICGSFCIVISASCTGTSTSCAVLIVMMVYM